MPRGSAGVVGHSPILEPGQSFEYVSGTQLGTPEGTMEGSFQMAHGVGDGEQAFDAVVPRTKLTTGGRGLAARQQQGAAATARA